MISKFQGRCKGCGKPTNEGEDIYWTKEEGGWHWSCWDSRKPGPESFRLADELGFIQFSPGMEADGLLRRMLPRNRSDSAERPSTEARRRQDATLFEA